jgi:transposase
VDKGSTRSIGVTIGLDLGDRVSHAMILDRDGEWLEERRVRTTPEAMAKAFDGYGGSRVVIEVGPQSRWVSQVLTQQGFAVIVANPRRVRLIAQNHKKNDQHDAELLARLGRVDPELLAPVVHRGEAAQQDLMLIRTRAGLVQARTQLINQVRGFAKSLGTRIPACNAEVFARRARATLGEEGYPGLSESLKTIDHLDRAIGELERQVESLCTQRYPETVGMRQVAGVGPITALCYVLTLEDPNRFGDSRTVGAYLGLCPRQHDSGEQQPQLQITKCGDTLLRGYLVQAAHYILGPFGPDCELRRYGQRIHERGGKNARKRAAVAVARKLAVLLHRLWLTGEPYRPFKQTTKRNEVHAT